MTRLKAQLEDICLLPRLAAYKYMNINIPHAKMRAPCGVFARVFGVAPAPVAFLCFGDISSSTS